MQNRLRYILSLGNFTKIKNNRKLHKMKPNDNPLEYAATLAVEKLANMKEWTGRERMITKIKVGTDGVYVLQQELNRLLAAAQEESGDGKYVDVFYPITPDSVCVDLYFIDLDAFYVPVDKTIKTMHGTMAALLEEIEKPHNKKHKHYYLTKFKPLYQEVISLLEQL